MGRPVLLYVTCLMVCSLVLLKAWEIVAGGSAKAAVTQIRAAVSAAGPLDKDWRNAAAASHVHGIKLPSMPAYKHYWVGNSSIPGAGLGVFARTHLPAGTIWNPEDVEPSSTLALTLPLWQSLTGLVQHLKTAGHHSHPIAAVWNFFDIHAYMCEDKYILQLTGSTFNNHAPEQPMTSSRSANAVAGRIDKHDAPTAQPQGRASSLPRRYANTAAVDGDWPVLKERRALGVTPWQICTVLVTLREISAGEELIEDYSEYDPPCLFRGDCPKVLNLPQPDEESREYYKDWLRAVLVQSPDTYVGSSSSSRPGDGLGVFAARDLPAGTVWNTEDAAHTLAVTRGQWMRLLEMHQGLVASGVHKPIVNQTVEAFRSYGFCCPLDGRMYVPFTASLLVKQQSLAGSQGLFKVQVGQGSNPNSSTNSVQRANTMHVHDAAADAAAAGSSVSSAASVAAHCTWLQTAADVRKGEELVVARSKRFQCNWPGVRP